MSEQQPSHLLPLNSFPLNHQDENCQSLPQVFNFPSISGEKFNSSYKEDPSKASFSSNSHVLKAIYPQMPSNSIQEIHHQLKKKKPLADLTNKNLSHDPLNIPDKNLKDAQNQTPYRILENKNLSLDNFNPKSHLSSTSFHATDNFMNPHNLQPLETKQKGYKIRTQENSKSSFCPDTETSIEEDFSLPSILKNQPKDAPILAKGSPSKYIDTTIKDLDLPDNLSDIPEVEKSLNTELETEDIQDMKETEGNLQKIVENREDLKPAWLQLSMDVRQKAIMGKIKEAYDAWIKEKDSWEVYAEKFDMNFYRVTYCLTFIQYLGCLFKEALPKLREMEEFYDSNPSNPDLGDKDIGYLYNEIGKCYSEIGGKGHKELAEKYLAMAKERLERCQKERLFILVHCLSTHGEHFLKYKDYQRAQEYFETVLKLTEGLGKGAQYGEPPKNCLLGWAYIDLADVLISQGDFAGGDRNLQLAIEKLTAGGLLDSFFMAKVKRNQARLPRNIENSVLLYEDALRISKETLPEGNQLEKEYEREYEQKKEECLKIMQGAGEP